MSTTTIQPTVGRVVWYHPCPGEVTEGFTHPKDREPLPAIIARVVDDRCVSLTVFDGAGATHGRPYVRFVQEGEDLPEDGCYAEWMPYQIGQAKKDADARQLAVASDREADDKRWRAGLLEMALRTPGLRGHADVLVAAAAYQAHIEGGPVAEASAPSARPDVKHMVDRFLGWKLPATFSPDCGISFDGRGYDRGWPTGTNLLNAEEARAMFEHALQPSTSNAA
jgi:hypothetical protein